jgi:signal transduction histidine kinase
MEIEITTPLELSDEETALLDMHSFINIMNVLSSELLILGSLLGDIDALQASRDRAWALLLAFSVPENAVHNAQMLDTHEAFIRNDVEAALDSKPHLRSNPEVAESLSNIDSVFETLHERSEEFLDRFDAPDQWVPLEVESVTSNLKSFFDAVAQNSKGKYQIVYDVTQQSDGDYAVQFDIGSASGHTITMPPVFQDVIRDLAANARKYTDPGGMIDIGIYEDDEMLRFAVRDTGRGIPADEIESVVDFGTRATNAHDKRTKGGGFGLTKAYHVTKEFGGRMWIASEEGEGTTIRIAIPRP